MQQQVDDAVFSSVFAPAQHALPTILITRDKAETNGIGDAGRASRRTLRKHLHADGAASCGLALGVTALEPGYGGAGTAPYRFVWSSAAESSPTATWTRWRPRICHARLHRCGGRRMAGAVSDSPGSRGSALPRQDRPGAVAKVVRVIEAMTEHRGISEISRSTRLPTSTVHRIVQELVAEGWARRDGENGYLPGVGLLTPAARAESEAGITTIAQPAVQRLRDATTHTVHLALRDGDQAVYVYKLEGLRAYEMRSRVGLAIPPHCTGIGKALLAALPEDEVRGILARAGTTAVTPRTIDDPEELLRHLKEVARRGYAIDNEENEPATRCVGATVYDYRNTPIGGISISSMAFELDDKRVRVLAPLVVGAAREISQALGHR
ncbi:IclR family transcriptional regulator C-terminal domain-containing protein [Streptomyces sp. NPDC096040]|uniref:IclR family transcriptional regulator domain-containing protein n=1 Tax=Streptomyces sp. NPDC096040 TaxID=3155541 RepID=UPI00332E0787